MLDREGKTSGNDSMLEKIYVNQLEQAERLLSTHESFGFLPMDYHRVLREPLEAAKEIGAFLGRDLALEAMAAVVDPALYRQRSA